MSNAVMDEEKGIRISMSTLLTVVGLFITVNGTLVGFLVSTNGRLTTLENTDKQQEKEIAELEEWKKDKIRDDKEYQKETSANIQEVKDLVIELKVILKQSGR